MAPTLAPREGQYLTDGKRLVRVLSVGADDVQVEDATTEEWESLSTANLGAWRPVKGDVSDGE